MCAQTAVQEPTWRLLTSAPLLQTSARKRHERGHGALQARLDSDAASTCCPRPLLTEHARPPGHGTAMIQARAWLAALRQELPWRRPLARPALGVSTKAADVRPTSTKGHISTTGFNPAARSRYGIGGWPEKVPASAERRRVRPCRRRLERARRVIGDKNATLRGKLRKKLADKAHMRLVDEIRLHVRLARKREREDVRCCVRCGGRAVRR